MLFHSIFCDVDKLIEPNESCFNKCRIKNEASDYSSFGEISLKNYQQSVVTEGAVYMGRELLCRLTNFDVANNFSHFSMLPTR